MPGMMEIYQKHAFEYDELVDKEDWRNMLPAVLSSEADFCGKTVVEFGAGTGRITAMYADQVKKAYCFDGSAHMLRKAAENLAALSEKTEFAVCDNLEIGSLGVSGDIVIQGWSFGHTIIENEKRLEQTAELLVSGCMSRLKERGTVIFIESLGTNTDRPAAPNLSLLLFFSLLEDRYGFRKTVVETDYKFDSNDEARRVLGFFFGEEMANNLKFIREGIVREFTGVWVLRK